MPLGVSTSTSSTYGMSAVHIRNVISLCKFKQVVIELMYFIGLILLPLKCCVISTALLENDRELPKLSRCFDFSEH